MRHLLQILQWSFVVLVLLILMGAMFGLGVIILWSTQQATVVNAGHITGTPTVVSGSTITPTRTPFQPLPTETITPTPTITDTPTPEPTDTETPTQIPTDLPTDPPPPQDGLPAQVYLPVTGYAQSYTLDCEARSAADLAGYFGVSIDSFDFLTNLPLSDDPNQGFVGNYWDAQGHVPPDSYGVYAGPVATLLRSYGLNAWDQYGMGWETLKTELAAGRPVMTWVIGNTYPGYAVNYTASDGNTTLVASYEHTVLVIGYDSSYVTLLDPTWGSTYQRTIAQFLESWSVLGYMAVSVAP